ncbi:hypothetical protein GALL_290210 [mine drainage metagenome]|uniref:Uncharacterized protein n=1 Tax=mine drainage metagenome TaxID=410659 RepID=A0A1J5RAC7_9ZZZZ
MNTTTPSLAASFGKLPKPDIRVGDEWLFLTRTLDDSDAKDAGLLMRSRVVAMLDAGQIQIEVKNGDAADTPWLKNIYSDQFDLLSREMVPGEAITYTPAFPQFRFPMSPGEAWAQTITQSQPEWELHAQIGVDVTVEAEDIVQVPAGTFKTLRLLGRYTTPNAMVTTHYWYAPAAGRAVKGIEDTLAKINESRVRVQYELQSLNRLRA